jgi:hypothetical protein
MNAVTDQENKTNIVASPPRPWWKFGLMGWTLILGLILLNAGVLVNTIELDNRTLALTVLRLDPHYWSLWPVPILWGIVAWLVCDLSSRLDFVQRYLLRTRIGIVIAVLCWTAWLYGWTGITFRRRIYNGIYVNYVMGPLALYQYDGTVSWRLLILPTFGVVTIVSLLYIAYQQRKKKP